MPDIDHRLFPKIISYRSKSRQAINNKRVARSFHFRGIDRVIETVSVQFVSLYFPFSPEPDRTRIVHARRDNPEWLLDNCEIRYCHVKRVNWNDSENNCFLDRKVQILSFLFVVSSVERSKPNVKILNLK